MDNLKYKLVSSDREMKAALEVRKQVFIAEQGVAEAIELDGNDLEALHMIVKDRQRVIGTARIRFPANHQAKIERMAILKPLRRQGIGKGIISFLSDELKKREVERIILHAQYLVIDFYRSCGFEETGSPFLEAGIKHIRMEKQLYPTLSGLPINNLSG